MACVVDEEGNLTLPFLSPNNTPIPAGIITKLRDRDGLTRKNLTYLVSEKEPNKGFLSWEMLLLKMREGVDISTFKINGKYLYFSNKEQEKWKIPVDPKTKSFLISFRAHTADFNRLSFYDILNGDFDRNLIKDRVVLIGLASVLMGDLHNTPLGWLPGITLNANAFLALYGHNFIKSLPGLIDIVIAAIGAVIAILIFLNFTFRKAFCLAILELIIFLAGSFILFLFGYTFDYALTVVMIIITAIVVRIMPTRYRPLECPDPSVVSLCLKEPQNHKLR
jgi:CHASE2 domain-containing sensor protein